jgi:hypothetical protein
MKTDNPGCLGRLAGSLGAVLGILVVVPFAIPVLGALVGSAALVVGMMLIGAVVMIPLGLLLSMWRR